MPPALVPYGEAGVFFADVRVSCRDALERPVVHATGRAGDVYLCHPFLVHAATWPHRGSAPRFMGQPCIEFAAPHDGYVYERADGAHSPCERAVRRALGLDRA